MNKKYLIDVFVPEFSRGLLIDGMVLQKTIGSEMVRVLTVPSECYFNSIAVNDSSLEFEPIAEVAVFIERLFEHRKLQTYKKRIFISNPEWLTEKDKNIADLMIDEFWHKTKFSNELLLRVFPKKVHKYTGFTSLCTVNKVANYNSFGHFPGKSKTRHTQDIIDIWLKNRSFPELSLQLYEVGLNIPKWIKTENIKLFIGFMEQLDLEDEYLNSGIHLCTSQMEGFGHYINEARSIGALIITLDAPPMNELVSSNCAIMIPTEQKFPFHYGERFVATPEAIEEGINRALKMPICDREKLGLRARQKFLIEQKEFANRLRSILFNENLSGISEETSIAKIEGASYLHRKKVFSKIYENGEWGKSDDISSPFYSGTGSHNPNIVSPYIQCVREFLENTFPDKPNVVDFGCGDFIVGSKIRPFCNKYIACDIVVSLIEFNKKRYSELNVDFRVIDLIDDNYPSGDVAIIRQVLQHLSNADIIEIIPKIKNNFKYLILTEHLPLIPNFEPNLDKKTGSDIRLNSGSGIVLTSYPFNLNPIEQRVMCEVPEYGGIIKTILFKLKH